MVAAVVALTADMHYAHVFSTTACMRTNKQIQAFLTMLIVQIVSVNLFEVKTIINLIQGKSIYADIRISAYTMRIFLCGFMQLCAY